MGKSSEEVGGPGSVEYGVLFKGIGKNSEQRAHWTGA